MKKKILSLILALTMITSILSIPAAAQEARSSRFFDGYALSIIPKGNGVMSVGFGVYGTGVMDKIGAYSIRIEEEISTNNWSEVSTLYGSSNSNFYGTNCMDHEDGFTFNGMKDVTYRAVLVAYAKNSTGSEYSDEFACAGKVCK